MCQVFGDVKVFGGEKQELSEEEEQLLAATTIREVRMVEELLVIPLPSRTMSTM